jgi:hypothetical protein
MVFATIYRSVVTRFLAAFIVVLVLSPYSEPFATIDGTDFGGVGAVDVGDMGKLKVTAQDALAPASTATPLLDVMFVVHRPFTRSLARDPRQVRLAILRL